MNHNYIVLLDYCNAEIVKIRLTEQEKVLSEEYEDFEEFLLTLEDKYCFQLSNCYWMVCETLQERVMQND